MTIVPHCFYIHFRNQVWSELHFSIAQTLLRFRLVTELENTHFEWKCYNHKGLYLDSSVDPMLVSELDIRPGGAKEHSVYVVLPNRNAEEDLYRGAKIKEVFIDTPRRAAANLLDQQRGRPSGAAAGQEDKAD